MYKTFYIALICFIVLGCAGQGMQKNETGLIPSGKQHISDVNSADRYPDDVKTGRSTTNTAEIASGEILDSVVEGDLVTIRYTARLENGTLLYTTLSDVADDPQTSKNAWYIRHEYFGAEQIVAGGGNVLPGLGRSIIGMKKGEKATVAIPPEYAFGLYDQQIVVHIHRVKILPRIVSIPRNKFIELFSIEPVVGDDVYLVPYFTSRIITATGSEVTLESAVVDDRVFKEEYGTTEIRDDGENIIIRLIPKIGTPFTIQNTTGRITGVDDHSFTVDFNHPLAGKTIVVDFEVLSITEASSIPESITWLENHDRGLSLAKEKEKAVVLMLYSESCWWCEKMMVETFTDPRIRVLNDRFVWVRIDSSVHTDLYDFYSQISYPMTIVLNPNGTVVSRIDGYRPAHEFRQELEGAMGQTP
ncbi:MAG: FKBP-type peptidyl-prolyl cis-trans isomerase [Deltaproteobacteria bacterium]|nr:FKBP-type peptidyl-prolyl cis-trans isomerase [Deltaproteobacteria bacterium]